MVGAAVFEGGAEGEVFEPAVGSGDEVEVGLASGFIDERKGRKRMGVSEGEVGGGSEGDAGD